MPRTFDRYIPSIDKDPNRFGTDYSDPLGAISDAAAVAGDQIRDALVWIIKDKTGIDLTGPVEFIKWLGDQIGVSLEGLSVLLSDLSDGIFNMIAKIIAELERITGLDFSNGPVEFLVSIFDAFTSATGLIFGKGPLAFIASIFAALTKATGLDFDNGPLAFIASIFTALSKATGLDFDHGPLAFIASLFAALTKATGLDFDNGPLAFISSLNTQITAVASKLIEPVSDLVQWVIDRIQELVDGIATLVGNPVATVGNAVQDAINAISGILGIATGAQNAADFANIGVAAIKAEQAGGAADHFDYPSAASLPAAQWVATYDGTNKGTWGPDGGGLVVWKPSGIGPRSVMYRRVDKPVTKASGSVSLVVSKPPHTDLTVKSYLYVCARMSASDKSCVRVKIGGKSAQFRTVNYAGGVADLGSAMAMPTAAAGDVFELKYDATSVTLMRNGILVGSGTVNPVLTGQLVGFGAEVPTYTWLLGHPAPEFAGIAWY